MWDARLALPMPATRQLREKLAVTEIEFRRIS